MKKTSFIFIFFFFIFSLYSCELENKIKIENENVTGTSNVNSNQNINVDDKGNTENKGTVMVDTSYIFNKSEKLYDEKKYKELYDYLDSIVKYKEENSGLKDFFDNTQIGKEYTLGKLGEGIDLGLDNSVINNEEVFEKIQKLYDEKNFKELNDYLDSIVKYKEENPGLKDFFKNTEIGKKYNAGKLLKKEVELEKNLIR